MLFTFMRKQRLEKKTSPFPPILPYFLLTFLCSFYLHLLKIFKFPLDKSSKSSRCYNSAVVCLCDRAFQMTDIPSSYATAL